MWNGRTREAGECSRSEAWIDAASRTAEFSTLEEFLADLAPSERDHVRQCRDCESAAQELLETRVLLAGLRGNAGSRNPFFSKRVMAAIAAREAELERSTRAWAAVPKLASRLAGVATVVLLIAGTWMFGGPATKRGNQPAVESGAQLFEDNTTVPSDRDDVLVSLLERGE